MDNYVVDHSHGVIQIHIPKTAGTTIRSLFCPSMPTDRYMHLKPDHPRNVKHWDRFFSFTFTRNPWDRLVSCYKFCFTSPTGQQFNRDVYEKHPDFKTFVMDWLNEYNIQTISRFEPQINWVINRDNNKSFGIDYIGKIEYLRKGVWYIIDRLRLQDLYDFELPHINQGGNSIPYMDFYDDETREKVAKLYQDDIKLFGYIFEGVK